MNGLIPGGQENRGGQDDLDDLCTEIIGDELMQQ